MYGKQSKKIETIAITVLAFLMLTVFIGSANAVDCTGKIFCWNYYDESTCEASDCVWQEDLYSTGGGWCMDQGCWNYDGDQTACEDETDGFDCEWEDPWCYMKSCWDITNQTDCEAFTSTMPMGGTIGCEWDGSDCSEKACWNLNNQSECEDESDELDCFWHEDEYWTGCEMAGCWNFGGDEVNCSNSGLNCRWNDEMEMCNDPCECWAYEHSDRETCEDYTADLGLDCMWEDPWCNPAGFHYGFAEAAPGMVTGEGAEMGVMCWEYDTESECDQQESKKAMCKWDSADKECKPVTCWDQYTKANCEKYAACEWDTVEGCRKNVTAGCWEIADESKCKLMGCMWDPYGQFCTELGCWYFFDNESCDGASEMGLGCTWKQETGWEWCEEIGCWNYYTGSECTSHNCSWEGTYCYEPGCWEQSNKSSCSGDSDCEWQGWGWCEENGTQCWDYATQGNCMADPDCTWDPNWDYCYEKGCWEWRNASTCNAEASCNWANSGWCQEPSCWDRTNSTICNDTSGCAWETGDQWCTEKGCWDSNHSTKVACESGADEFNCTWDGTWNYCYEAGCWDYSDNQTACNATADCDWEGWCYEKGCWNWWNKTECVDHKDAPENCVWNADYDYCYEKGCWDYMDVDNCTKETDNLSCKWDSTYDYCYEKGCWELNQTDCKKPFDNCKWDGAYCYYEGCWDYGDDNSTCENAPDLNCAWETYCYELGCWNNYDEDTCTGDPDCAWDFNGYYCYEKGCWNHNDKSTCEDDTTLGCDWDDTWDYCYKKGCWENNAAECLADSENCNLEGNPYCYEEGCWNHYTQSNCEADSCIWNNEWSYCYKPGCWDYSTAEACNTTPAKMSCAWDSQWGNCYEKGCWDYSTAEACDATPANMSCVWDSTWEYCYEEGCWNYNNNSTCAGGGCMWQNNSYCEKTGCWNYDDNKTACEKDAKCAWDSYGNYCYEKGCWDYNNETKCNADSQCTWASDEGGWCDETGVKCWEFDYDKAGCQDAGCEWDDTWNYCYEKGCWDYEGDDCVNETKCQWNTDSWGWCEQKGCWDYDDDETNCTNSSQFIGINCTWEDTGGGDGWCYEPMKSCSGFTTKAACIDTFYCIWIDDTCTNPGAGMLISADAPDCWIFNNQGDKCNVTDGCSWNDPTCTGDEVTCEEINDSDLCNNIPALPTCCKWIKGNCTQDNLSMKCYDNLAAPPDGAMFCDDVNAINNEQMCNKIAGDPWYMPCKWDSVDQECRFNFEDVVGLGAEFEDIKTKTSCEYAGGTWIVDTYCDDSGNEIPTGWCEVKVGLDAVSCNDACWACEFNSTYTNGTAKPWPGQQAAKDACNNSRLGICEWTLDADAPYGWICKMNQEAEASGGVDCDSDCTACDMVGSTMKDTMDACQKSKAKCRWFTDPTDPTIGWCDEKGKKQCSDECEACENKDSCQNTGKESPGSCKWDNKAEVCAPKTFYGEMCSDGVDNDNNGMTDCDDPMCMFDPLCGGGMMSDCPMYPTNKTCMENGTGCVWIQDPFGGEWCDMKGANCWMYDLDQENCTQDNGCNWHDEKGWCDINITKAEPCFTRTKKDACTGDCVWIKDDYSPTGGWCEYKVFACGGKNQSTCKQDANCEWASTEHGSWCDPKCHSPAYQKNATCSGDGDCTWITGWCEPEMSMMDCFKHDGDQGACDEAPGCMWFPAMGGAECGINHSMESVCMDIWDDTTCDGTAGCAWMSDPRNPGGGWCDFAMFKCGMLDKTGCDDDTANCTWVEGGMGPGDMMMGPHCEPVCFGIEDDTTCSETDGCKLMTGLCDPAMMGTMFKGGMDMAPPVPLGGDMDGGCGEGSPDGSWMEAHVDICGFGLKDEPDVFNIGIGISSLVNASICNGKDTQLQSLGPMMDMGAMQTMVGSGTETVKFYYYLDTNGTHTETDGCPSHDGTQNGFEFFLKYKGEWADTGLTETQSAYKCEGGSWKTMDSTLSGWNDLMCKVGSGMVAVQKSDLSKHSDLYNAAEDIIVYAATANRTSDEYNPTDTIGPSTYVRGSVDFKFEDCMAIGVDMDGDGFTAENDPDCQEFFKQGFTSLEEGPTCNDGIDNDNNDYTDCDDPNCKYDDAYCDEFTFTNPDLNDTKPPSISWKKVKRFKTDAHIMYDTNEPANGTLSFYGVNNSTCKAANLVRTVNDTPIDATPDDIADDFKTWHDAFIEDLSVNTTYYYKLTVCDPTGNCAYSGCMNFTTKLVSASSEFVVDFKFQGLASMEVTLGDYDLTACGRKINYTEGKGTNLTFENTAAGWSITLVGIDMTGTVSDTWRDISNAFIVNNSTSVSVDGEITTTAMVGMYSEVFKKILASGIVPDAIRITIPQPPDKDVDCGDEDYLVHCDDEGSNCKTVNATCVSYTSEYSVWGIDVKAGQTFSVFGVIGSPSGDGDGDGARAGGGGGGVTAEATATPVMIPVLKIEKQVLASVKAGVPATVKFSKVDVSEITFTVKADAKDVEIEVSKLGANPADTDPSGTSYSYMKINTRNLNSADISSATIQFKVENSWIEDNNMDPATVILNRDVSDTWNELSTTKADEDRKYTYFDAETPGFSYFGMSGEPDTAEEEVLEAAVAEATPVETAIPGTIAAATPTPAPTGLDMAPLVGGALAVMIAAILVVVLVLNKSQLMTTIRKK